MENNTSTSELLNRKIYDCDFSVRLLNCLKAAGIETVADIIVRHKSEFLSFSYFGKKCSVELEEFLESKGIHLGMNILDCKIERGNCVIPFTAKFKDFIWEKKKNGDGAHAYFDRRRTIEIRKRSPGQGWDILGYFDMGFTLIHDEDKPIEEVCKWAENQFKNIVLTKYFDFSA